jgi:hypothetical protein
MPTTTKTQFVAGWNMPGYLPDTEPFTFDSFEEAKADVIEELRTDVFHLEAADAPLDRIRPFVEAIAEVESWTEPNSIEVGLWAYWIQTAE